MIEPVPPATARGARAACSKGNRSLQRTDAGETGCTDEACRALFPTPGPPAQPPWRLAGWSRSGHVPQDAPSAKRPTRCAVALTGHPACAWSARSPGARPRAAGPFARASSRGRRRRGASSPGSRGAASAHWAWQEAARAPTLTGRPVQGPVLTPRLSRSRGTRTRRRVRPARCGRAGRRP